MDVQNGSSARFPFPERSLHDPGNWNLPAVCSLSVAVARESCFPAV